MRENGTRVIRRVRRGGRNIAISRAGGLFIEIEDSDSGETRTYTEDVQDAARCLNLLLCDLAIQVIVSDSVGPFSLSAAHVDEERAVCGATVGGNVARNLAPQRYLADERSHEPAMWQHADESRLDAAIALDAGTRLERIHVSLPPLVVAAYSRGSWGIPTAGGVVDQWMVIEQLLNHVWEKRYAGHAIDGAHRRRLKDFRNFTANQRAEVLLAAGVLSPDIYVAVQAARKHRNDLAHNAKLNPDAFTECMAAMQSMIGLVLGFQFA